MNKIFIAILLMTLLLPHGVVAEKGYEGNTLTFQVYNAENNTTTTLALKGNQYVVTFGDNFTSPLSGELINEHWYNIETLVESSDFFNLALSNNNPTYTLAIAIGNQQNEISVSQEQISGTLVDLISYLTDLLDRLTGSSFETSVWPVEASLLVLESYPPQYAVSVLAQRGPDLLKVVMTINFTLIAAITENPVSIDDTSWVGNDQVNKHKQVQTINFDTGGMSKIVDFDIFDFGDVKNLNYSNLVLGILVGGNFMQQVLYLQYLPFSSLQTITVADADLLAAIDNIPPVVIDTRVQYNPLNSPFSLIPFLAIPVIIRRKKMGT